MVDRDWSDGEAWGADTEIETCPGCKARIHYTAPNGPPGGIESYVLVFTRN
jgi:hypothetical protein